MTKRGKLANMRVMGRDASIRASLPETKWFTSEHLMEMLKRYGDVIVKPNYGSGGVGVIKVSRMSGGKYAVHFGTRRRIFTGQAPVFSYLKRMTQGKYYIVQRCIALAQVQGRPFDLRVMAQRKKGVPWTVTGKLAKIAGPNQIITNVARSRGYVLSAETALKRRFSASRTSPILRNVDTVGLRAAKQLGAAYGFRTLGFDMAVDRGGKIWVLEANSRPAIGFFRRLTDKSAYRRIVAMQP